MKISIGAKIVNGPWGGGNLFAINLTNYLRESGHEVVFNLEDGDIDIILLMDPRKSSESSSFTHKDITKYLKNTKKDTLVVHRINECDQRKGTSGLNKKYIKVSNKVSDFTIFVSDWLLDIYEKEGFVHNNYKVIKAGADKKIFNDKNGSVFQGFEKLKIVTHHWSNNWNKGFDVYEHLDTLLGNTEWNSMFEFLYIGNLPRNFSFKNTEVIAPLSGKELADELKSNHIYLTASINEPSGNHHIEGAQCGLPLLYIESGGIPEYCNGYGLPFNYTNFEETLLSIKTSYFDLKKQIKNYPFNSDNMCQEFLNLFEHIISNKSNFIKMRKK